VESIDRSIDQTDRQTDRRFRLRLPKKNAHRRRFQSSRNSRVFLSIDPIDRFPIETRDLRGTRSIRFDPIDSTRSIRVRFDSVLIRYRYRFDRTRESIGGFYRSNAHRVAVRRTVRRFRRTVGRSVDSRSLSTSSDGYTDRTDRYRETPTRGRADETDRYDSSSDSSSDSTDGRTDGRSDDADPPVDRYPSSIRSSAAALRAALSVIFNEVSLSVRRFGPPRAESSVGRSVGFAKRVRLFVLVEGGGGEIGGEGGRVVGRSRADADEDNRGRGGCLTEVGLRLRASGRSVDRFDSIRFDSPGG